MLKDKYGFSRARWGWVHACAILVLGSGAGCTVSVGGGSGQNDNTDTTDNDNGTPVVNERVISTLAGIGLAGLGNDGQPILESPLYLPQDVTVGPDGLLYVVDWNNHRIRRINADGTFETLIGTGELGDGQDGYAKDIQMNHPTNIAFDAEGRMIIAAWHNSKVKRLDLTTGLIENVAGTGKRAFNGDVDENGDPRQANVADLDLPSGVAVDSGGNIYISDQANFRIRIVEPDGTIHTFCGDGTPGFFGDGGPAEMAQLNNPKGQSAQPAGRIDIDAQGRIYIADTANHVIRMIDVDRTISTIAGTPGMAGFAGDGGPATDALLNTPSDVEVAADGSVYIADTLNSRVRVVSPEGIITTIAGNGDLGYAGDGDVAVNATLNRPYGVTVDANGVVYIADTHNHVIRQIATGPVDPNGQPPVIGFPPVDVVACSDVPGTICTYAGTGQTGFNADGLDRTETVLYWPFDIEFTPMGHEYVLDWNNHRIREILDDGTFVTIVGKDGVGDGPADLSDLTAPGATGTTLNLNHPTDIFELPSGVMGFMAWHNHKIRTWDPATGLALVIMGRQAAFEGDGLAIGANARVNQPSRAVLDPNGNLFIIDQRNQRIRVIRNFATDLGNAIITTVVGTGMDGFNGDGLPLLETQVSFPKGGNPEPGGAIAMDDDGILYFSDTRNNRIRKVEFFDADFLTGEVTTIAGTGDAADSGDGGPAIEADLNFPQDLEIGPDGNVYFADTNNNRVRMIDLTTGMIEAVAGTGEEGYSGDGGLAITAKLNRPFGVAFDENGDLYISDTFNSRIRKVNR